MTGGTRAPANLAVTALLAGLVSAPAEANRGDRAGDYACFQVDGESISFCAPPDAALIWMDVDDNGIFAHYETAYVSYTIAIEDAPEDQSLPTDIESAIAAGRPRATSSEAISSARRRAFVRIDDVAVMEAEIGGDTMNLLLIEIRSPGHITTLKMVDFSVEYEDVDLDWAALGSEFRDGLWIAGQPWLLLSQDMTTGTAE